jgi:hypothetical protein
MSPSAWPGGVPRARRQPQLRVSTNLSRCSLANVMSERVAGTPLIIRYDATAGTFLFRYRPDPAEGERPGRKSSSGWSTGVRGHRDR